MSEKRELVGGGIWRRFERVFAPELHGFGARVFGLVALLFGGLLTFARWSFADRPEHLGVFGDALGGVSNFVTMIVVVASAVYATRQVRLNREHHVFELYAEAGVRTWSAFWKFYGFVHGWIEEFRTSGGAPSYDDNYKAVQELGLELGHTAFFFGPNSELSAPRKRLVALLDSIVEIARDTAPADREKRAADLHKEATEAVEELGSLLRPVCGLGPPPKLGRSAKPTGAPTEPPGT